MRRHALFNIRVIERPGNFGDNAGKLCVKPGDFGCNANAFRSLGRMGCGGMKAQSAQAFGRQARQCGGGFEQRRCKTTVSFDQATKFADKVGVGLLDKTKARISERTTCAAVPMSGASAVSTSAMAAAVSLAAHAFSSARVGSGPPQPVFLNVSIRFGAGGGNRTRVISLEG